MLPFRASGFPAEAFKVCAKNDQRRIKLKTEFLKSFVHSDYETCPYFAMDNIEFFGLFCLFFEVGNLSDEFISLPARNNVRTRMAITNTTKAKIKSFESKSTWRHSYLFYLKY